MKPSRLLTASGILFVQRDASDTAEVPTRLHKIMLFWLYIGVVH